MLIINDVKLDYKDVLIVPQRSTLNSRSVVDITREFKGKWASSKIRICPIIASNMWNTGTREMATALEKHHCLTTLHKYYSLEELKEFLFIGKKSRICFVTIGESLDDLEKIKQLRQAGNLEDGIQLYLFINIDVANGYRESFVNFVKKVREVCRSDWIMAGNVTTPEMTQELILAGADIVKIGIGPGSVCETRRVTGVGYPMLSAIIECANAAHGLGGHICADGGCKTPADVAKAFCSGADFVMLGGILAGTDECQGEWSYTNKKVYKYLDPNSRIAGQYPFVEDGITGILLDGSGASHCTFDKLKDSLIEYGDKVALKFFGMSSHEAMEKFGGTERSYRASEGRSTWIDYKGPVEDVIREILGGLRSCGTYIGASRLKDFSKCATFIKVNS